MPTKPLDSILDRELSKAAAREVIDVASPLLQELVNFSTRALARSAVSATGETDVDVAILALYRHIIEMTDAIEVLISHSCPIPAIPLLRSSFEALLSIEYILEKDVDYVRRSLSWLVAHIHQSLDMYERLDRSTTKGEQFTKSLDNDKTCSNVTLPSSGEARKARRTIEPLLGKSHIQPIEKEFQRLANPKWYQLFSGPTNLRSLAEHLNRGAQYDVLYRAWSKFSHAQDLHPFLARTSSGEPTIGGLRHAGKMKETAELASYFILEASRLVLGRLRQGEDISRWYLREVRERYLSITGKSGYKTAAVDAP